MKFEVVDGSLIGGSPATHLTPVLLEMGQHWEIQFVVIPKMSETIILGLAWLNKGVPPFGGRTVGELSNGTPSTY